MHEKIGSVRIRDQILNHQYVLTMDAHEQHAMAERTKRMSEQELQEVLDDLYNH